MWSSWKSKLNKYVILSKDTSVYFSQKGKKKFVRALRSKLHIPIDNKL